MKTPKECKSIEELIEVEMDMRGKLIIQLTRAQATITVMQRTIELLSGNPTEELLNEARMQVKEFNSTWQTRELEVVNFLDNMKHVVEMRKELTPKYQPIFVPGGAYPGMGLNPMQ